MAENYANLFHIRTKAEKKEKKNYSQVPVEYRLPPNT